MSAADEYRLADSETVYTTPQQLSTARRARAVIAEMEAALAERDSRLVRIVYLLENSRSYEAMVRARAEEGSEDE